MRWRRRLAACVVTLAGAGALVVPTAASATLSIGSLSTTPANTQAGVIEHHGERASEAIILDRQRLILDAHPPRRYTFHLRPSAAA